VEDELYMIKDKLKRVLDEKIQLENELNHIERVEESRLSQLEDRFGQLTEDYVKLVEENKLLKKVEADQKKEIGAL